MIGLSYVTAVQTWGRLAKWQKWCPRPLPFGNSQSAVEYKISTSIAILVSLTSICSNENFLWLLAASSLTRPLVVCYTFFRACHHSRIIWWRLYQNFDCLAHWKTAWENNISPMTRCCRTPYSSGCKRTATSTRKKCMFLFKVEDNRW